MLELTNIRKSFFSTQNILENKGKVKMVLQNISLKIPQSSSTKISGENGCGKTTLLRIISNSLLPDSGYITFSDDFDCTNVKLAGVNTRSFFLRLTVQENLEFFADLNDLDFKKSKCIDFLKAMQIIDLLDEMYSNLSNGQQKLLQIARCFINDPKVLLIDELGTDLDTEKVLLLNNFLSSFIKNGGALIFTSHKDDYSFKNFSNYTLNNGVLIP